MPSRDSIFMLASLVLAILAGCDRSQDSGLNQPVDKPVSQQGVHSPEETAGEEEPGDDEPRPVIRFSDETARSGIDFEHHSGDNPQKPFPAANGSGIAAFDYDLDGRNDLLFLNGTSFPLDEARESPRDRFYRNRGNWSFAEITAESGLGSAGYSAGVATGDFNSDGFPDVFINCFGENRFYLNQGDGTFREAANEAGLDDPSWGTSAACLDFNNDGNLDLYVCNYAEWSWETNQFCGDREKNVRIFCSPRSVRPVPDRLYENLGNGRFRDVLEQAGINREPGRGQGVVAADIDRDGLVDLYVGNDINSNFLFRNAGGGKFEDLTDLSGTAFDFAGRPQAGMGVDVADIDRDGLMEIFVTNYEDEHNTLYRNLGNHLYQDVSQSAGLAAPSMRWIGWGTRFIDFDLDGWSDLVVTNGHTDNNLHDMGRDASYEQPPLLFHNRAGRLIPVRSPPGSYFAGKHPGRSLCAADLDGDLATDLVIGHQDRPPALLRNISALDKKRLVLSIRFLGIESNRDGIGTQVEVLGTEPGLAFQVKSGGSYLASQPYDLIMSLPAGVENLLEIRWPNGYALQLAAPEASGHYTLIEGRRLFTH
ncbi:MAG TPA: CRTAC1 family protein [Planctomycetaceae bacterium]|nr:CRTAC1 family protein [Planctomycetaceae bacterium]